MFVNSCLHRERVDCGEEGGWSGGDYKCWRRQVVGIGDGVGSGLNRRWGVSPQAELGRIWIVGKDFYLLTTLHFPHFIHYSILLRRT